MCVSLHYSLFLTCLDMSTGMCVMYRGGQTRLFQLSTQCPRSLCPKPIHLHHPRQLPVPPSAWENHTGMSLRDAAAQINKPPPLQVCPGADNGGKRVYLQVCAFVFECFFWGKQSVSMCMWASVCLSHSPSLQWVHTARGGNQYQLSSNTKRVKRSIPPQHDNCSSQAWLI